MINEKLKELLKNAEKFDGLSFIKDRIANREQIRKEKREKLKELMTNETKQTAVKRALLFTVRIALLLTVGVVCKLLLLMFDGYNAAFKKGWH